MNCEFSRSEEFSVVAQAVSKNYGRVSALRGVSLAVQRGEFISLLGPSGCGKTTLLRIIAGLETVTSGTVLIAGNDVTTKPPYARSIGLVFQNYALFPHKSVAANVNFGLRYRTSLSSADRARTIEQALKLVRLEGHADRKPTQLSGGQQQRVALARAIVTKPEVLLLDEPLSNLDAKLRDEMRVELAELHRTLEMTFIYVTHDRSEALSMSDRIAVVNSGRIRQVGGPKEVFERPNSVDVADFIGHSNLLGGNVIGFEAGIAEVRLDEGPVLRASAPKEAHQMHRVRLLVRRNAITLHDTAAEAVNSSGSAILGRVRSVLYQGLYLEVHIELARGSQIRAEVPTHIAAGIAPGKELFVGLLTSGTWVLAEKDRSCHV